MWYLILVVSIGVCALILAGVSVNAADGDKLAPAVLSMCLLVTCIWLSSDVRTGTTRNLQGSLSNGLSVGVSYQTIGTIPGTDIVAVRQISTGTHIIFSTGGWKLPPCFVETRTWDETQFQPIECPK